MLRFITSLHCSLLLAACVATSACTRDPVVEDALSKQPPPGPAKRRIKVLPRDPRLPAPADGKTPADGKAPATSAPTPSAATDAAAR